MIRPIDLTDVHTMDAFETAYVETALWSSLDPDTGRPLDYDFDASDIHPETLVRMRKDCAEFREQAGDLLDDVRDSRAGHDFWLTRNRHGAGFWDGYYSDDIGQKLTDIARSYGSVDLCVVDGKVRSF